MDAIGKYTVQQVYSRVRCMGICCVSVGNLQLRVATVLWDDARRSGQIHQRGQCIALSRQYAAVDLRFDEALLEQTTVGSADLPHNPSDS